MKRLFIVIAVLLLPAVVGAASHDAGFFGHDTAGASGMLPTTLWTYVVPDRASSNQHGDMRIDSVLFYGRKQGLGDHYIRGCVYNYDPVAANCTLQTYTESWQEVDNIANEWVNVTMPGDTLSAFRQYMVGVQTKGLFAPRIEYTAGSSGDSWEKVGDDDGPPETMDGKSDENEILSIKAYYTVVSDDTLIVINTAGADSADWIDAQIFYNEVTINYGDNEEISFGQRPYSDVAYTLFEYENMSGILPSGKVCDSAYVALTPNVFAGDTLTDSLWPDVRRVRRDWVEMEVTWTIYSTGNGWETAGAWDTDLDIWPTPEETDDICRCKDQVGWEAFYDTTMCGADDTLFIWLDPNTIDSMSSEDLDNYGWKIQYSLEEEMDIYVRHFSRDRTTLTDRPYLYIFCSDTEEDEEAEAGYIRDRHADGNRHSGPNQITGHGL